MKIIVIGLGNLGTGVSVNMDKKGHRVTAIDIKPELKMRLGKRFSGIFTSGSGMNQNILEKAGIQTADSLVVCTQSDEINAVIARIAKNVYLVPTVIARLYDVRKAHIYQKLGIQVISVSTWGIERVTEILTFNQFDSVYQIGDGNVNLIRVELPLLLSGRSVKDITIQGELNVVSIARGNHTFIPTLGTVLEDKDLLYLSVCATAGDRLKAMFGL